MGQGSGTFLDLSQDGAASGHRPGAAGPMTRAAKPRWQPPQGPMTITTAATTPPRDGGGGGRARSLRQGPGGRGAARPEEITATAAATAMPRHGGGRASKRGLGHGVRLTETRALSAERCTRRAWVATAATMHRHGGQRASGPGLGHAVRRAGRRRRVGRSRHRRRDDHGPASPRRTDLGSAMRPEQAGSRREGRGPSFIALMTMPRPWPGWPGRRAGDGVRTGGARPSKERAVIAAPRTMPRRPCSGIAAGE